MAFAVVLALLFSQGARVCVHTSADLPGSGQIPASTATVHFESLSNADDGIGDVNQHLTVAATLVKFLADIPFVFLVTTLFLLGIVSRPIDPRSRFATTSVTYAVWSLRPPLRAPPR